MEHIRKAIARAKADRKADRSAGSGLPHAPATGVNSEPLTRKTKRLQTEKPWVREAVNPDNFVQISRRVLQENRIIAHESKDPRSIYYDMLRTRVLGDMSAHGLKSVAITSPKLGCGKTVTALNLALSLARQSEGTILLVDLDLRRPMVARYMGMRPDVGIEEVITGQVRLADAVLVPDVVDQRLMLLPAPRPANNPTEQLVSSTMKELVLKLRNDDGFQLIIFDLPPMLSSDDFMAFLPQADCALLIAAAGQTTVHELTECERLMPQDAFLGCVLNKATAADRPYGAAA
jgi:capsular exopolysaccharide synthesis family protein